jgi:proteasome lid subunit RPN8/RPN11
VSECERTIEITPAARAAISREIKAQWDGRELGGALVGHSIGGRIVVTDANGIGVGVETPRGETWMRPARGRWADFARACGAEVVGDWHCHPGGGTVEPSDADVRSWEAVAVVAGSGTCAISALWRGRAFPSVAPCSTRRKLVACSRTISATSGGRRTSRCRTC